MNERAHRGRRSDWISVVVVFGIALIAGSRLIALGVQQHAARARESAQVTVPRYGSALEAQLRALADLSQRESARAVGVIGHGVKTGGGNARTPPQSAAPAQHAFWIAADGTVLRSPDS